MLQRNTESISHVPVTASATRYTLSVSASPARRLSALTATLPQAAVWHARQAQAVLTLVVAMGGGAYYITMPKVVKVNLTGKLNDWVSAKDVILKVLQIMSVKGGVGKVIESCGEER